MKVSVGVSLERDAFKSNRSGFKPGLFGFGNFLIF